MGNIITISNLTFHRGSKTIFDDLSISIPEGKITAIMGPSGTGKTTLLKLIGGQLKPELGEIIVDGENVHALSQKELYRLRGKIGVLFQEGGLFTDLNVFENVAFPLREHTRLPDDMIHDLVLLFLQAVGLRGAAQLRIDQLSGGMARRVALARAVILNPTIMLYDEPFSGQDPIGRGVLLRLIRELNDALNLTTVLVSHDVEETARVADYIVIIFQGRVVGEGVPQALLQNDSAQVQQFVRGTPDGPMTFHYPGKEYAEDLLL